MAIQFLDLNTLRCSQFRKEVKMLPSDLSNLLQSAGVFTLATGLSQAAAAWRPLYVPWENHMLITFMIMWEQWSLELGIMRARTDIHKILQSQIG